MFQPNQDPQCVTKQKTWRQWDGTKPIWGPNGLGFSGWPAKLSATSCSVNESWWNPGVENLNDPIILEPFTLHQIVLSASL